MLLLNKNYYVRQKAKQIMLIITEQASEPDSSTVGMLEQSCQEFKTVMNDMIISPM